MGLKMEIKPLIPSEKIQARIAELSGQIQKDMGGKRLTVVGVLKGSFIFMADLVRQLQIPVTCDFLRMASYDSAGRSTGATRLEFDLTQPIEGKDVLLVEDIVDAGLTASYLLKHLKDKGPRSVKLCALLHKPVDQVRLPIDYLGFEIPNVYVVGFGMDLDGEYRSLPYIAGVVQK